jgi:hypothetical protein
MKKLYDLAVKTGSYEKDGQTKNKWMNVGSIMEGDNGKFMFLSRCFNPAGIPNPDNKENILISMFAPKDKVLSGEQKPVFGENPFEDGTEF